LMRNSKAISSTLSLDNRRKLSPQPYEPNGIGFSQMENLND
jgi:hypothetical protein